MRLVPNRPMRRVLARHGTKGWTTVRQLTFKRGGNGRRWGETMIDRPKSGDPGPRGYGYYWPWHAAHWIQQLHSGKNAGDPGVVTLSRSGLRLKGTGQPAHR